MKTDFWLNIGQLARTKCSTGTSLQDSSGRECILWQLLRDKAAWNHIRVCIIRIWWTLCVYRKVKLQWTVVLYGNWVFRFCLSSRSMLRRPCEERELLEHDSSKRWYRVWTRDTYIVCRSQFSIGISLTSKLSRSEALMACSRSVSRHDWFADQVLLDRSLYAWRSWPV